ncbi:MCE family protein [Mycobacterium paraintracellulare]|uniref:MCE family protein n=1 Tax=Mycobacterium paraintracellulare TaxID=1138383 RepID=UPI00192921B7|nr:MCE family protein [Mycobacterium paraintracellulare]BCP14267.1 mammalian cell entry protein [Mycobacterium paraintracellulare]
MIRRKRLIIATFLAVLFMGGSGIIVRDSLFKPKAITAFFTTVTGIYPGDQVRVAGVKVGKISSIQPEGTRVKMTLAVDRDVPVPAEAKAVIVAQNLVSARYVQLAPAYQSGGGPTLPDGATIPIDRTAVPVEWDALKDQLMRLATDLGPNSHVSTPAVAKFIDTAANALDGNGDKLRQTLAQLSALGRTLADGSGDIVTIVKNLQTFVTALRDSNEQIVQFQGRLATLSSVVAANRSTLEAALKDLSVAVGDVRGFVAGTRDATAEQVQRLANVSQTLADHHEDVEQLLHVAPTAIANFYNIYNPDTGASTASFVLNPFSNPVGLVCGMIGAVENTTAPETSKLCTQYLGPALRLLNFNSFPIPFNPVLMPSATPGSIIYSEQRLAPGGEGPKPGPPEIPPAVSAYTGLPGDPQGPPPPPPLARIPGAAIPAPAPTTAPEIPPAGSVPNSLPEMLLPAQRPGP